MTHPCCTEPLTASSSSPRPPHEPVPVVTQYASPDLIGAITYEGHDPAEDPRWAESGAPTQRAYRRWCRHLCGMACLRMVLLHRDGQAPSLFQLLAGARPYGAYTTAGGGEIKGLIYAPFTQYADECHGLPATVHRELPLDSLVDLLERGQMVMASVSKEIRRPDHTPPRRGGHLVLAIGHQDGSILYNNPSGHTEQTRRARLPVAEFGRFFGARGIALDLTVTVNGTPGGYATTRPVAS
ncbi:C39 family peptidase [Streptomyces sp. NPDC002055]|uniref:C39 family peptidase n=1 Tax=Streptomyces sp. NPDC002055 TaxID=3154534 RepID=UPI0033327044